MSLPPRARRARPKPSQPWIPTSRIFVLASPTRSISQVYLPSPCPAGLLMRTYRWACRSARDRSMKLPLFESLTLTSRQPNGTSRDRCCNRTPAVSESFPPNQRSNRINGRLTKARPSIYSDLQTPWETFNAADGFDGWGSSSFILGLGSPCTSPRNRFQELAHSLPFEENASAVRPRHSRF